LVERSSAKKNEEGMSFATDIERRRGRRCRDARPQPQDARRNPRGFAHYYATLRSLCGQCRTDEINSGETPPEGIGHGPDVAPEDETSELVTPPRVSLTVPVAGMAPPQSFVTVPVTVQPVAPRISSSAFSSRSRTG
jgi:hypothetical protein